MRARTDAILSSTSVPNWKRLTREGQKGDRYDVTVKNEEYPSKTQNGTKKGVPGRQESQTQGGSLHLQLSEQTGVRKGKDRQLSVRWECSKSLAHSVKMSNTLWNNGPGTILNPRHSSKGCTQEHSPEQNKACAVKEFTQKKYIRCVG